MQTFKIDITLDIFLAIVKDGIHLTLWDKTDFMEVAWHFIENSTDEDQYEPIISRVMELERYYTDCVNDWVIPTLKRRLENGLNIDPKKLIYLIYNWKPGKIGDDNLDVLGDWVLRFYEVEKFSDLDKDIQDSVFEYGIPSDWKEEINNQKFLDKLREFTDYGYIDKEAVKVDIRKQELLPIFMELVSNGKCRNNLNMFLETIAYFAPTKNQFRPYYQEYICDIIEAGEWDEEEYQEIIERFYDIDFELPYRCVIDSSIKAEVDHINRMSEINPNYRHD